MAVGSEMKWLLALCAVVSILPVAEISVRLFSRHGYFTPETLKARSLQYESSRFSRAIFPQREQRIARSDSVQLYINPKGYRGHDFSWDKPEGVTRIIFYGGSSVFDYLATEGKDWPHRVESLLRSEGFRHVEIINAGTPGHTSFDALGMLYGEGHLLRPDFIVLCCGWNDMQYLRRNDSFLRQFPCAPQPANPLMEYQNSVDRSLCGFSQLYVRLRYRYYYWRTEIDADGKGPAGAYADRISETGMAQFRYTLEAFVDMARNAGATPVLMTEPRLVSETNTSGQKKRIRYYLAKLNHMALCAAYRRMDELVHQVSSQKQATCIDAARTLTGKDENFHDHVHVTTRGSEELARIVAAALKPLLDARKKTTRL